ncbi:MAG: ester cyclase [marine benthic group bacterium]|jgi:predicted ester cyclase|nr:ester cyclase [Gemmatimonadota bacterium]MCL7963398.1 ester cyclase [Candidatus Carthagonibacter metallireducens]MCL7937988.1 ester cyclase [Gemmatimonadota bacterium]MCL7957626.1 ester cyclase [Gemmatimonadota bacterium]MCL7966210.1 ester cyclase [Gemmatimonadota bacterium]
MGSIKDVAARFFDACETGKGWEACRQFCHGDASFSAQADTFAGIETLEGYTEAMKGLIEGPVPDASYEMRSFAVDEDRGHVTGYAVFRGTHSGEGGPIPPTGKQVETDYVYVMEFDGDRIRHMTKIWNDGYAMRELGWG